jgi:hypothetical protein
VRIVIKISALAAIGVASLLSFAMPVAAANQPKTLQNKTTETTNKRKAWPPETISGSIMLVDPAAKILVVQDAGGTPFDLIVNTRTRIEGGGNKLTLNDLEGDTHKGASVRFIPERGGDVALSIQVQG